MLYAGGTKPGKQSGRMDQDENMKVVQEELHHYRKFETGCLKTTNIVETNNSTRIEFCTDDDDDDILDDHHRKVVLLLSSTANSYNFFLVYPNYRPCAFE